MADYFEMEMFEGKPGEWNTALNGKELDEFTERSKKDWDNKTYYHDAWFFGSKKENIPKWTGYSIGFSLVKKYFEKHPDQKPSTVYKMNAEDFIS